MATPREKLTALKELVMPAQVAAGELDKWVRRVTTILDSPEITLTNTQKGNLIAAWGDRLDALAAAQAALGPTRNLATWEPPEEPEEE